MKGMTREGQVTEFTIWRLLLLFCIGVCAGGLYSSKKPFSEAFAIVTYQEPERRDVEP